MSHPFYIIKDWDTHYENSRSRAVENLRWVSVPNKHDGEGYGLTMEQDNAAELFAAWVLIVQVASKCQSRGTLARDDGSPLTARSLAAKTRAPEAWFTAALEFFTTKTLWLERHSPDSVASPDHHLTITQPSPSYQVSADRREGNRREEKGIGEDPSFPSSETYVESRPTVSTAEGRKEAQPSASQKGREESLGCSEEVFMIIARRQDIDETFAKRIYLDLLASGWKSANGSRVVSPASYLLALWSAREEAAKASSGIREPWMVDRDLKRLKDEIKRISEDPASKHGGRGATLSWEEHKERYRADWMTVVKLNHDEAKAKLPEDFKAFEASLEETRAEMRKGAAMLGIPADQADSEDVRLEHFVTCFPDDCPTFERWDKQWNKANTWKDPKTLTEEAKAEISLLRSQVTALENERRSLLSKVVHP